MNYLRRLWAWIGLSILIMCASAVAQDTVKPYYGNPLLTKCSMDGQPQLIQVVIVDQSTLYKLWYASGGVIGPGLYLRAFTLTPNDTPWAHRIYVQPMRGQDDAERMMDWGHELVHAVCGSWHDEVIAPEVKK